jgi:hypothetical protein
MTALTSCAWLIACALAAAGLQRGDGPAGGLGPNDNPRGAANQKVLRISKDDGLTLSQLAELRRHSGTARDLLDRVANLPATILIVRAHPGLVQHTGVYAHGRFWISGDELFGDIQYQPGPLHNVGVQCLIVHELAHAVEVATADRRRGTGGLRAFVLSRARGDYPANWRGTETKFPRDVANAVLRELLCDLPERNVLAALAEAHHITLPAAPTVTASPAPSHSQR